MTIKNTIELCFPMIPFIKLYRKILTFDSVNECEYSSESCLVLSRDIDHVLQLQIVPNFESVDGILKCDN